jgi:hypothetical protein
MRRCGDLPSALIALVAADRALAWRFLLLPLLELPRALRPSANPNQRLVRWPSGASGWLCYAVEHLRGMHFDAAIYYENRLTVEMCELLYRNLRTSGMLVAMPESA